ncbi:long-chain-fatty-acid--CoA ligase [Sporosarcina obsidiansis]|uniref:long-chain-fatty-acid--CoA ligase n=1 Tax=Sporosarcina obsidiansis TaxID=2660748 RepID=UPI00129ADFD6|nr:long-chain-fatty-acid--CoA ligase [Sporosarcina obsidiansis]
MNWNLDENLRNSTLRVPEQTALICEGMAITYKELDQKVECFAAGLASQGINKGDTVAVLVGNRPEFVIAFYGILRRGAVAVPINPTYTLGELEYILSDSETKAIIAHSAMEPILTAVKKRVGSLNLVVYTQPAETETSWEQFMQQSDNSGDKTSIVQDDLAVILYTSGTTGKPKGAMLSHRNLASNAEAVSELLELTNKDRMLTVLPMFHVLSLTVCLNAPIASGSTILLVPHFSPTHVVNIIQEEKATIFVGVPTMYNFMLQLEATANEFASIRVCASGGDSIPLALLQQFESKYQVSILEGYGLSEAAPVTSFNPLRGTQKPGSVGVDIPNVKNKVVDPDGREVPAGEVGELIVQGPNVMMGYLGMPEETRMTLKEGWLFTGDLAKKDEEGYIYIVDRKKDIILVGGYNVYPREVEEVLYQHPLVREAAVIGVADPAYGERVKAYVVKKEEALTEKEMIRFCSDHLAKYKLPKEVEFVAEMPRNSTGKILRRALRTTDGEKEKIEM